ncbi:MAG: sulfotransferase [Betaproteobacteria bacterium]|nr:sulfotransferase [Betaproteobacteria bacterium]
MTSAREQGSAPFFVVGAQRSGTTMLRLMLNAHPRLCVPFESGFIIDFHDRRDGYGALSVKDNAARLLDDIAAHPKVRKGGLITDRDAILARPIEDYADLVDAIFSAYAEDKGKPRWADKTPWYVTEIDKLWGLFPSARIIHLVRDGRDVALSLRNLDWGSRHLPRVAADWRWKTTLAHKVGSVVPTRFLEVRYEDLVLQTQPTLERICAFVGEAFDPGMLAFHRNAEQEMPQDSVKYHRNSVRSPNKEKVYAWKERMSSADRIIFEQIAGAELSLFGYEREDRPSTWMSRLKNFYYCAKRW